MTRAREDPQGIRPRQGVGWLMGPVEVPRRGQNLGTAALGRPSHGPFSKLRKALRQLRANSGPPSLAVLLAGPLTGVFQPPMRLLKGEKES